MSKRGISFRLNSHITTIAILIIATIVYINYHFSNKILKDKIEEGAINQSNLVISKISRITIGTEEIARNVSYQALYFYRKNDLDFLLKQILASNRILESIHIDLIDNQHQSLQRFSSDKPDQFIAKCESLTTEQFIKYQKSGNNDLKDGFWSDPFYCNGDTVNLFASYKKPIFLPESKEMVGMVSCVISLNQMNRMLSEIKIGKSGYTFIIDHFGNLITHPKKEWILKRNLFEKPSLIFSDDIQLIESEIKSGRRGADYGVSEYLKKQPAWYYYSPLSDSNWTVIIVIPESEMFKEINLIFQKITSVSVFGILILFLLNMFIFRRMLDPLARIAHSIQQFSSTSEIDIKSKDEIKMLAESLENWQEKYGMLINEQSKSLKEKLKYEKDLKSAHEIQQNIIPSGYPAFPDHPGIDLFALLKPAESIGGDLYDYYFIDDDHLLIAIGDVSGKGIPASLFMAIASTLIKSNSNILSSNEIIENVNKELGDRNPNQYFLTLFIGVIDLRSGVLDYCNAAHNYPFILRNDGTVQVLSKSHGIPLGIYKNRVYKSTTIELQYGDLILLYTDGVINSRDSDGTHYGMDKLKSNMQVMSNLTAQEVVTRLLQSIIIYEGENLQSDDISLMALKFIDKTKNQA